MSCTNPNCNEGCGCNNCCPPVPPPTPPTPPICEGTDCTELYDGACVNYTGPAIPCLSILTNANLNSIIQTLAASICTCCGKTECISPFKLFFERFKFIYDVFKANDPLVDIGDVFDNYLKAGIIFKKCEYCASDSSVYVFGIGIDVCKDLDAYMGTLTVPEYIHTACHNCWDNYETCATTFLSSFDSTFDGTITALTTANLCENGGFNNLSNICELNKIFENLFTYAELTAIMEIMYDDPIWLVTDLPNGNIAIGNQSTIQTYINNYMQF